MDSYKKFAELLDKLVSVFTDHHTSTMSRFNETIDTVKSTSKTNRITIATVIVVVMLAMTCIVCTSLFAISTQIESHMGNIYTRLDTLELMIDHQTNLLEDIGSRIPVLPEETVEPDESMAPEPATVSESPMVNDPVAEVNEPDSDTDQEYNLRELTKPTGFSAEQLQTIVDETYSRVWGRDAGLWLNHGDILASVEENNGFNSLYILGIGGLESGFGTSGLATKANNPYGMIGREFDTVQDATIYLGNLLADNYIGEGRLTLVDIGKKYCPPTYEKWAKDVQWITNQFINTAEDLLEEGVI